MAKDHHETYPLTTAISPMQDYRASLLIIRAIITTSDCGRYSRVYSYAMYACRQIFDANYTHRHPPAGVDASVRSGHSLTAGVDTE
jgi:hypothetical protein